MTKYTWEEKDGTTNTWKTRTSETKPDASAWDIKNVEPITKTTTKNVYDKKDYKIVWEREVRNPSTAEEVVTDGAPGDLGYTNPEYDNLELKSESNVPDHIRRITGDS